MNDDDVARGTWADDASLDAHDVDAAAVDHDDELLDLLGSGERPAGDDPFSRCSPTGAPRPGPQTCPLSPVPRRSRWRWRPT
ncbi:hypothetical protein ACFSSF_11915 [Dietzia aerolata]|uniref:hypothetical protein n=1 Tax=Dietzia aerolata TaxID=595984 RepID=UPI0036432225